MRHDTAAPSFLFLQDVLLRLHTKAKNPTSLPARRSECMKDEIARTIEYGWIIYLFLRLLLNCAVPLFVMPTSPDEKLAVLLAEG